jgi:hypothetical protein
MAAIPTAQIGDEKLVASAKRGIAAPSRTVERHQQKAYRIAFDFSRDREEAKICPRKPF